jgi:hypothetical protein
MKISRRLSLLAALAVLSLLFGCSLSGNDKDDDNPLGWDGPDSVSGGSSLADAVSLSDPETWYKDDIDSSDLWFKASVTVGTSYTVVWDDYDMDGDYDGDVEVRVYSSGGIQLGYGDGGFDDFIDVTPAESVIYIKVSPYDEYSEGNFAIGFAESSTLDF